MNKATNNLSTMVHMQQGSASSSPRPLLPPAVKDATPLSPAVEYLLDTLSSCGENAEKMLEAELENMQDIFLLKLEAILQQGGVALNDKLTITLTESQTLVFQCNDDSEELLTALGGCEELQEMFVRLHKLALMSQGLHYMNRARSHMLLSTSLPQYKMCMKGPLSHFYLKHARD